MKSFFSSCLGTIFGLFLFCLLAVVGFIALIAGLSASATKGGSKEVIVQRGAYLVLNLSANITDAPPPSELRRFLNKLSGDEQGTTYSTRQILSGLRAAAKDDRIGGIFLTGDLRPESYGSGFAALREIRQGLIDFRAAGKKVVGYMVTPSKRDFYLISTADTIYLNPYAEMDMSGLASEPVFFGDALKKYGIGIQVTRVGKYKSFVEPYILNKMSDENREQVGKLLNDLWAEWRAGIETSRKVSAARLQEIADTTPVLSAEDALKEGLVTKLAYLPEVIEELRAAAGSDSTNTRTFRQVGFVDYQNTMVTAKESVGGPKPGEREDPRARIAIVYAEGGIVDGNASTDGQVAGDRYARELRKLRQDPNVKAIVLRVNSPGGSALASEIVLKEMELARADRKPVIVSFGTVAASGGYYIACASDRIFCEPNTITGSIGVFGILPNIKDFANNWGVTFDSVTTSKFGNITTIARPKTPEELAQVQRIVDRIYDSFVGHVAKSRNLSVDRVKEIAQGRVWSGSEAVKLGLVDEVGGLEAALAYAREKTKVPADFPISEFPSEKDFQQQLAEIFTGRVNPFSRVFSSSASPTERAIRAAATPLEELRTFNDPLGAYARLPFALDVK
jgi:protease IV